MESRVKWYQKTERGENTQTEGGEAAVGAGQVWNWFYVCACRDSSGVKLHQREQGGRGRRNCWRLWIISAFVCLSAAWLSAACSFLLTHSSEPADLHPRFQVNEPRWSRPRVWEPGWDVSVTLRGRALQSLWVSVLLRPCHDHQLSKDGKCPFFKQCVCVGVCVRVCLVWWFYGYSVCTLPVKVEKDKSLPWMSHLSIIVIHVSYCDEHH